ncbi:hypothetical protein ACHAPE_006982 [Trichoderma viride]
MSKRRNEIEDGQASPNAKRTAVERPSEPAKLDHAAYTIGWICALPKERTAAIAMLDKQHTDLLYPVNDDNVYALGSIGGHNIVIACLPKGRYGNNSAAIIATKMTSSFPAIKFGLLVGIGGGIPSKVRLGDVVVSAPTDQYPGVVQLDFGKAESDGTFRRTGALNSPPSALLKVLAKLESEHEMQEPKIPRFLDEMRRKWPKLYPKYFWNDSLKDPQDGSIGKEVDASAIFTAHEPHMKCPGIHHGLIASGNRVVKDASFRDRLDKHLNGNLLCLDMEAAGLMNDFPCLVVRGICDYADSAKNDDWQEYAAAVAAAYAKEIISGLRVYAVEHMDSVKGILSDIQAELGSFRTAFDENTTRQYTQDHRNFLNSLPAVDYTLQQKDNFIKRQPGTGQWLLNSDTYRSWVDASRQTLFCPGIPGAGKTTLTSIIINDLFERFKKDTNVGIAYVYFNFRQHDEQKPLDLLTSILKQLAQGQSCLPQRVKTTLDEYKGKNERLSLDDAKKLLQEVSASYSRVFILLDALDECQGSYGCRASFLEEIFLLQGSAKVNVFATSRIIPEIMQTFKACKSMEIRATQEDVQRYVRGQLEGGGIEHLPSLIKDKPELEEAIVSGITNAVDGMFLLAKIFLDSLVDRITIADVKEAIAQLPTHMAGAQEDQRLIILDQAYDSAWARINQQKEGFRSIATRVLAWITCAKRPLSTEELQHALAVKVGMGELDEDAIPQVHDMVSFCAGLVTIDEESNIIKLVHYTTQQYFERKKNDWFHDAEAMIAEICISYLSFEAFGEYGDMMDYCTHHLGFDYCDYLCSHALYKYASQYWAYHARPVGKKLDKIILSFLMSDTQASNAFYVAERTFPERLDYEDYMYLQGPPECGVIAPMSGMHLAVLFAFDEAINLLFENGYSIIEDEKVVVSPLFLAIDLGYIHIAQTLLDNGDHISFKKGRGRKYLDVAMQPNNYDREFIKKLIAKEVALGEDISWFLKPAIEYGHSAMVELLIQLGADIETIVGYRCHRPLHLAIQNEHMAIIKLLLDKGANIENASNLNNETPLHVAARIENPEITALLLEKGADIKTLKCFGKTPLHSAAEWANVAVIKLLLEKGANIKVRDSHDRTPLF